MNRRDCTRIRERGRPVLPTEDTTSEASVNAPFERGGKLHRMSAAGNRAPTAEMGCRMKAGIEIMVTVNVE
jgi:hypothetical protein